MIARRLAPDAARSALLAAASLCALLPAAATAQNGNPLEGDANAIRAGGGIFAARCAACHGADAKGATGPDLTSIWAAGADDGRIFESIRDGIEGSVMPPSQAADDEIWAIVAYLRDIGTVPPFASTGDPAAGGARFADDCAGCHRIAGRGGTLGPDLTRIAAVRSRDSIVRSLREPSESVAEGFRAVTLVARDGERIEGLAKSEDAFSIQIIDTNARLQGYRKADFVEIVHEDESFMPRFGRRKLNERELEDLLAFLLAERERSENGQP